MAFLFKMLGLSKQPSPKELRYMLPATHSFIDCTVRGGPKGQVCFEGLGSRSLTITKLEGMRPGQTAVFSYTTTSGKYSFAAPLSAVGEKQATLPMPNEIKVLQKFTGRARAEVRIDTTVAVQWRYKPMGRIKTEYQKGTLSDLSRGGAQLTVDRELQVGEKVEVSAGLRATGSPVLIYGEVKRVEKTPAGKFNAGLAFIDLKHEVNEAIAEFIHRRQLDLRSRGMA